ncbi:MAG: glycosyltransferase [Phormidesmis sp.]
MKERPLISVVIPCYNRSKVVKRAISSALQQTYQTLEIVVVDDASADSKELFCLIHSYKDSRLRLIRHSKNRYASAARNTGVQAAKGVLIAFLDSDDEWLPQKLEKQVEIWNSSSKARILVYSQSDVLTRYDQPAGNKIWPQRAIAIDESIGDYLFLNRGFLQTSTILIPRAVASKVQFNEALQRHTDYDFLLRLEAAGVSFLMVEEPLAVVHWEDLDLDSRGQTTEKSLAFLSEYKEYISPRAANAFCLRQVVYQQMRTGKRRQALSLLLKHTKLRYSRLLDLVNISSLFLFKDDRLAIYLANVKALLLHKKKTSLKATVD